MKSQNIHLSEKDTLPLFCTVWKYNVQIFNTQSWINTLDLILAFVFRWKLEEGREWAAYKAQAKI